MTATESQMRRRQEHIDRELERTGKVSERLDAWRDKRQRLKEAAAEHRAELEDLVFDARSLGWSDAYIARRLGLSRQALNQRMARLDDSG